MTEILQCKQSVSIFVDLITPHRFLGENETNMWSCSARFSRDISGGLHKSKIMSTPARRDFLALWA